MTTRTHAPLVRGSQDVMVGQGLLLWSTERLLPFTAPRNPSLTYSPEARPLLTPFRRWALRSMFEAAIAEGGNALLADAGVDGWLAPADESEPELVLNLLVDGSWDDVREIERRVMARIAGQMEAWSEAERQDYAHMIYLSVGPISP